MKDKCGIVGAYSHQKSNNISRAIYYGLYALQHRGQESAGISVHDGKEMSTYRGMGLVCDVFKNENIEGLEGYTGIGHVRYSTTGESKIENSQPFFEEFNYGAIAIAHNGDIINSSALRDELKQQGYHFKSSTDSEVIFHLLTKEYDKTNDIVQVIQEVAKKLIGSYSLVILLNNDLIAVRDPSGIKPLSLGKKDDITLIGSESVAFDVLGGEYIRAVEPGEILVINDEIKSFKMNIGRPAKRAHCMFEYVYFARPDSILDDRNVYNVRLDIGRSLSKEYPTDADVVMPVPD